MTTSLGSAVAIRDPPICDFFQRTKKAIPHGAPPSRGAIGRARDSAPRFLHHQLLIQSDDMKWRFPGQCASAILDRTARADVVRALL
jgi:hypothetical protein